MAEAVTLDMASSDWFKLADLYLFCAQSVSKKKSICDCSGARPQSDGSTLLSKIHSCEMAIYGLTTCDLRIAGMKNIFFLNFIFMVYINR